LRFHWNPPFLRVCLSLFPPTGRTFALSSQPEQWTWSGLAQKQL
jgi:hypothetical protein